MNWSIFALGAGSAGKWLLCFLHYNRDYISKVSIGCKVALGCLEIAKGLSETQVSVPMSKT